MPWYLYLALKQLFPTGRVFSFFTLMSALGVGVGVALLVVSTSIMGGFGTGIKKMIVDTQGEIQVFAGGNPFPPAAALTKTQQTPGVAAAVPLAIGNVLIKFQDRPAWGPVIQGFDLQKVGGVVPFEQYLIQGKLDDLDDDSLILSRQLASSLGVRLGDELEVWSQLHLDKLQKGDEALLPKTVRVVGIFEIGHQALDKNLAIASLRMVQDLYGLGNNVHGLLVRLKPGADEFKVAAELNRVLPPGVRAQTWFESNAAFQSIIRFEKNMIFFLLFFIIVVAALSIMSSLTIAVVRKTREIGLLGALGGKSRHVAACFCAQGFVLGVLGTLGGLAISWLVIHFRDEIVSVLARATVSEEVFQQFYGFVHLPSHTDSREVTMIVVGAIVSATLAGLIPAWRAARLKPVEALRSE